MQRRGEKNGKNAGENSKQTDLPRSLDAEPDVVDDDDADEAGGSSVISCKLYSLRTSWTAANSLIPKF